MLITFAVNDRSRHKIYFINHTTNPSWGIKNGKPTKRFIPTKENIELEWENFVENFPNVLERLGLERGRFGLVGAIKGHVDWLRNEERDD